MRLLIIYSLIGSFLFTAKECVALDKDVVVAQVLGQKIMAKDAKNVSGLIWAVLMKQFVKENNVEPTPAELEAFTIGFEKQKKQSEVQFKEERVKLLEELKSTALNKKEREAKQSHLNNIESMLKINAEMKERDNVKVPHLQDMKKRMAENFVRSWKINKALYDKYGGRVIFQQAGPEPVDAYRKFLEEEQAKGSFKIIDKSVEEAFWKYYTNDAMHSFYSMEEGAKIMSRPWWPNDTIASNDIRPAI